MQRAAQAMTTVSSLFEATALMRISSPILKENFQMGGGCDFIIIGESDERESAL